MNIASKIRDNLKNIAGWRTPRRLVAFAVDDYCNVRVPSRAALTALRDAGLELSGQFDRLDTVETRQDLEALFETLDSVRDGRGQPAVFTAYALSSNPDFERIQMDGKHYHYEPVPETFGRLAEEQPEAYEGAWALWQEGMQKGLIRPQFHGREHLNIQLFERKLRAKDPDLIANLENRSMAGLSDESSMPGVGFTHAFGLHESAELAQHREILEDGLNLFEQVWGFRSSTFTPPAQRLHPDLYDVVKAGGVVSIDKPLRCSRPMGDGTHKKELNRSGRQRGQSHVTVVRNVVFEPGKDMGFEPVGRALEQVHAAFRWRKPAIISTHRVNFCGHLEENNRQISLKALAELLKEIVQRWPDVEFVSVDQLVYQMNEGG